MASNGGTSIVILGGGFGGLTAANELAARLSKEHRITLIDREPQFFMGLAKLWVLAGRRQPGERTREYKLLNAKGVEFVQSEVMGIDAQNHSVTTASGRFPFDYLIVSLGAELSPESTPGFTEGAHNLYSIEGIERLRKRLQSFKEGRLVVVISATPFRCPSAPYEAAMIMDEMLRLEGTRDKVDFQVFTPEPQPLPIAGPAVGAQVKGFLSERGIGFNPGRKLKAVDAMAKSICFEDGSNVVYDLLAGVPTHTASKVVRDSGLSGPSGWIPVSQRTLETRVPRIYALGDVAVVMTTNNLPMPKLGILAEEEAKVVANNIANQVNGMAARNRFEGVGRCFVEVGGGKAAQAEGEFLAEPGPKVTLNPPTSEALEMKREFESSRLASWF